ncbi:MAG: hypothetical protein RIS36_1245 [Pseudomonadota bacterium]
MDAYREGGGQTAAYEGGSISSKTRKAKQNCPRYVESNELDRKYVSERRARRRKTNVLMSDIRASLSAKLRNDAPPSILISSRMQDLERRLIKLLPFPVPAPAQIPKEALIIRAICDVVEEHLTVFVTEFPDLYSERTGARKPTGKLEKYLSTAAKAQEASLGKCHDLLEEFEILIQGSAKPLIERYNTRDAEVIAGKRVQALRHLRATLPTRYSAPNGRPVEQVKHVLTKQLQHIFSKHGQPIKQSSRTTDSLSFKISIAVRDALKFHSFDMSESLKAAKRRSTPR